MESKAAALFRYFPNGGIGKFKAICSDRSCRRIGRKWKHREVHVARTTSSLHIFFLKLPLASFTRSRIPERHGLFTVEHGRAGSDDEDFGEETGLVLKVDIRVTPGFLTVKQIQMQDFLKMYSNLVERCFTACCNDFTSKALSSKEV